MKLRLLWYALVALAVVGCATPGYQLNRTGVEYYNQGNFRTAKEFFLQALNYNPNAPHVLYNLASCCHKMRQYPEADRHYRRCISDDPTFAKGYHGLAALYIEQEQEEKAFSLMEDWARKYPDTAAPRIELAWLHRSAGDLHRARQLLQEALGVERDNTVALTDLADINYALGLKPDARALYEQSLALNPDQPGARARLAALQAVGASTSQPTATDARTASEPRKATTR